VRATARGGAAVLAFFGASASFFDGGAVRVAGGNTSSSGTAAADADGASARPASAEGAEAIDSATGAVGTTCGGAAAGGCDGSGGAALNWTGSCAGEERLKYHRPEAVHATTSKLDIHSMGAAAVRRSGTLGPGCAIAAAETAAAPAAAAGPDASTAAAPLRSSRSSAVPPASASVEPGGESLLAQPRQYVAVSRLMVWQMSQTRVIFTTLEPSSRVAWRACSSTSIQWEYS
jgi:hypothetical protein